MSRCFPFPPPGYEKKTRTDDVNLLKKEKDKEEKRKKEKKKEKKEEREKYRSDGKHKDKKEKKEKHCGKKKDKDKKRDKDKDKEKKTVADEKKFPVQYEVPNSDRPIEKEHELKDKNSIFRDERLSRNHTGSNGEKLRENANSVKENKGFEFILELDRRIKYDDGGGSQMPHKFPLMCHKKAEATARVEAKGTSPWQEGNERGKEKDIGIKKSDGLGIRVDTRPSVNANFPNRAGIFQPSAEGIPKVSEKNFEKMQESKEPINGNKDDGKRGDKCRYRYKDKKGHGKDKDWNKEKRKEEEATEQVERKNSEHSSKLKESNIFDPFCINSSSQPLGDNFKNASSDQNLKKRKDFEPNDFLRANDNCPNKLPRSSSHPFSENGSMPELKQIDMREARPVPAHNSKSVSESTSVNQVATVSVKSPHPDTKYLKQVYTVPQMDIWSELDDQEWLFNRTSFQQSKSQLESSDSDEIPLVWAEALQIEQADVCVLPYVIPY